MDNDIVKLVVLLCTAVNGSINHSVTQSVSSNQSITHSISVNQSIDPSVNLSINSIYQSYILYRYSMVMLN